MGKGREENLIPNEERTPEELRKITTQGGIASGKARRQRKLLRETLEIILSKPFKDGDIDNIDEIKSIAGIKGTNLTADQIMMVRMVDKAIKGDAKAIEYITNMLGENPIQKLQIDTTVETKRIEIVWEKPPRSESSNAGDRQ